MVPCDLRNPAVTEVVFRGRVLSIVRLQQADEVTGIIIPETGRFGLMREVIAQRLFRAVPFRHREITGQNIVERWNVGRTLNRSVTTQRQNSPAGPTDVAEQELQDRRGANDLNAFRMLCPPERITNRGGLVRT